VFESTDPDGGQGRSLSDYAETVVASDPVTAKEFLNRMRHLRLPILETYETPQVWLSEQ
jgi:hypothetical protein